MLAEWEASGLSKSAFAKKRGLSTNSLHRWAKALKRPAFVEVVAPSSSAPTFVLRVGERVHVEVPVGFDPGELRRERVDPTSGRVLALIESGRAVESCA